MSNLMQYWAQVLTQRRGYPPFAAAYQRRQVAQPSPHEHPVPTYHPIVKLSYGAYAVSPQLQILQTYPFSGHIYTQGVPIGVRPMLRGHRAHVEFPSAHYTHTIAGPPFQGLEYSWQEQELR